MEVLDPPFQPGEQFYQSPMTLNVTVDLLTVLDAIRRVCNELHIPYKYDETKFKFKACAYYTSGFAKMSARIWKRKEPHTYAVELFRDGGVRMVVSTVFKVLSNVLNDPGYVIHFDETMFDWEQPRCSIEHSPPRDEILEEAAKVFVDMLSSEYDDVSVNGLTSVLKLCTSDYMSKSPSMIAALSTVLYNTKASITARTLAALALSHLTKTRHPCHACVWKQPDLSNLCTGSSYKTACLNKFCAQILGNLSYM